MNEQVNESLREHVTRTGFDLSLGKTHIFALVMLDLKLKENRRGRDFRQAERDYGASGARPGVHRLNSHTVTGMHGLYARGLAENITELRRKPGEHVWDMTPRRCYRITRAGRLVIDLLKESGIYQEFAALIPMMPARETGAAS